MTFSLALENLEEGAKVARKGWNGKNMYIVKKPGYPDGIPANEATAIAHNVPVNTLMKYSPYIEMKAADGSIVPWLASQTDILTEDWEVVD